MLLAFGVEPQHPEHARGTGCPGLHAGPHLTNSLSLMHANLTQSLLSKETARASLEVCPRVSKLLPVWWSSQCAAILTLASF